MSEQPQAASGAGRRIMILVLIVLGGAVLFCGLMAGGSLYVTFRASQAPAEVAQVFLDALAGDDYDTAYDTLSPGFQEQFDGRAGFADEIQARSVQIAEVATFTQRDADGDSAQVRAPVTFEDGARQTVYVELTYNDDVDGWVITRFGFE